MAARCLSAGLLLLLLGGCVLAPPGAEQEKQALREQGKVYQRPLQERDLPPLPANPTWRDLLQRAFLANGELEAAYFEWTAAVERIDIEGAWPNTNLSLGFDYMFSDENLKSWDRTTISLQPDPMVNLSFPTKTAAAARVALAEAQAAGERFAARKFALQRQLLQTLAEYALVSRNLEIQQQNVALLEVVLDTVLNRVHVGVAQQDLLRSRLELERARDELATMQSQLPRLRATLNGMLAREAEAPLPPLSLEELTRALPADDAELLAAGVNRNPQLAALARQVEGRQHALDLARQQFIPDFNPAVAFTGSIEQAVGMMVTLPTTIPQIQASIRQAQAMLRSSEALTRQTRSDQAALYVATLYALRDAERQGRLFEQTIVPLSQQAQDATRQAYATGRSTFVDLIDAQRTVLEAQLMLAQAQSARERWLASLEELAGIDIETLDAQP